MPATAFTIVLILPALHLVGLELRGAWVWAPLLVVFGLIPLLDPLFGRSLRDRPEAAGHARRYDLLLELWFPLQAALIVWTLLALRERPATGASEWAGLAVSLALTTGAGGINIAHELMHRRGRLHRALGEALMSSVLYAHFCVEHVLGHHRMVATPEDGASARRGEAVYAFVPRSVVQGWRSAWRLEGQRCLRHGVGRLSLADRRLRHPLVQGALLAAVGLVFGAPGLTFFLAQAAGAVLLLEVINYIEHYGLARARVPAAGGGERWERVEPRHSWNSTNRLTGAFLFHLTRHSDHHAEASRPYDLLRALPAAPHLPAGYPAMMLLSLLPPLWFRVMDPRADAARAQPSSA